MAVVKKFRIRAGGICIRENLMTEVEDVIQGHEHCFDHCTVVVTGSIRVECFQKIFDADLKPVLDKHGKGRWMHISTVEVTAGGSLDILAEHRHRITSLEANTKFACVFAHRSPLSLGLPVWDYQGWDKAYASTVDNRFGDPFKYAPDADTTGGSFVQDRSAVEGQR